MAAAVQIADPGSARIDRLRIRFRLRRPDGEVFAAAVFPAGRLDFTVEQKLAFFRAVEDRTERREGGDGREGAQAVVVPPDAVFVASAFETARSGEPDDVPELRSVRQSRKLRARYAACRSAQTESGSVV